MKKSIWLILILTLCLTGCRGAEKTESETETKSGAETSAPETEETGSAAQEGKRPLTLEELNWFSDYLSRQDNYGFLISRYDSPEYVNLDQVFYSGAGIERGIPTDEEIQAYLKASGEPEIYTDVRRLSSGEINEFLKKKTGIPMKDAKKRLHWTYLPEYDRYISQCGDTNYTKFVCVSGTVEEDIYTIQCVEDADWKEAKYVCVVTLKKQGEDFLFVSNQIESGSLVDEEEWEEESGAAPGGSFEEPIFDSDSRYYTEEELKGLAPGLRAVFRNEIYARHGYIFSADMWREFFKPYSWYEEKYPGEDFNTGSFNEYETANLKLVREIGD